MNIPGLAEQLYGMTKQEAIRAGICIDCKKNAKWYSPEIGKLLNKMRTN